jgi:sigma-B regulation protein RsbU (phosphoserine phosphatase)
MKRLYRIFITLLAFGVVPLLLMATDGIWETRNRENAIFGKNRLRKVIRQWANHPAETIKMQTIDAVSAFRGSTRQTDDITLMVVKRRPAA